MPRHAVRSLVDRGVLVRTIESTDPRASMKRTVLRIEWIALIIVAIVFFGVLFYMGTDGDGSLYVILFVLLGVLILDSITMLFISHHFRAYTEPINIYSNGIEAYSSFINKLRGVDGYLQNSELIGIQLKDVSVNAQGERDYDRSITLQLASGRNRLIGIRSREMAMNLAKTMSIMWALPIEDFPARPRRS